MSQHDSHNLTAQLEKAEAELADLQQQESYHRGQAFDLGEEYQDAVDRGADIDELDKLQTQTNEHERKASIAVDRIDAAKKHIRFLRQEKAAEVDLPDTVDRLNAADEEFAKVARDTQTAITKLQNKVREFADKRQEVESVARELADLEGEYNVQADLADLPGETDGPEVDDLRSLLSSEHNQKAHSTTLQGPRPTLPITSARAKRSRDADRASREKRAGLHGPTKLHTEFSYSG